jgi:hypothetical protein
LIAFTPTTMGVYRGRVALAMAEGESASIALQGSGIAARVVLPLVRQ